jgi:phage gp16-like protein
MRRRGATSPVVLPPRRGAPLLAGQQAETRAMQQKVQIARRQLGLADDDYRAILLRVTGKSSSRDCGPSHLDALLAEFRRLGWKAAKGSRAPSPKAQLRMIYAVFADIRPHLAVGDDSTLRAFVRRQTRSEARPGGVDAPEFLSPEEANKVLEGLKAWRARVLARVAETPR